MGSGRGAAGANQVAAVFTILGTKDCVVWTWVVDSGYYEGSVGERETGAYLLYYIAH